MLHVHIYIYIYTGGSADRQLRERVVVVLITSAVKQTRRLERL